MRLMTPADVERSVEWYVGMQVAHVPGGRATRRTARAKRLYWASLHKLGLSFSEVARVTGAERSGIYRSLKATPVPEIWIDDVLKHARSEVEVECKIAELEAEMAQPAWPKP